MFIQGDLTQALERAQPYLAPKYQAHVAWGQNEVLGQETFRVSFAQLARDRFLLGNPNEIVQEIKHYEEPLGVAQMVFRIQWPGMPHDEVMRQLGLFGRHVAPYFV